MIRIILMDIICVWHTHFDIVECKTSRYNRRRSSAKLISYQRYL